MTTSFSAVACVIAFRHATRRDPQSDHKRIAPRRRTRQRPKRGRDEVPDVTIPASDRVNCPATRLIAPSDGKGKYPAVIDREPLGRSTVDPTYVDPGLPRSTRSARQRQQRRFAVPVCLREKEDVRGHSRVAVAHQPLERRARRADGATAIPRSPRCSAPRCSPSTSTPVVVGHPPTNPTPNRDVRGTTGSLRTRIRGSGSGPRTGGAVDRRRLPSRR